MGTPRRIDITGAVFGKWTVVAYHDQNSGNQARWACRCQCGNERVVCGRNLRAGVSTACQSCSVRRGKPREDLAGRVFGNWTVIEAVGQRPNRQTNWRCRCSCGHIGEVASGELRTRNSLGCRSCKAKRQQRIAYSRAWHFTKVRARHRGIAFDLDRDFTLNLLAAQGYRCALTGLPIEIALSARKHQRGGSTASIDRIDSSGGYTADNIQWVHKDVNRMKWVLTQERFIEICGMVAEKHLR